MRSSSLLALCAEFRYFLPIIFPAGGLPHPPGLPTLPQSADYALRYHSLHDNQYLRYFRGHTGRITTLTMSPKNDLFMSAAEVGTC